MPAKGEDFCSGRLDDVPTDQQFEFAAACQRAQARKRRPLHWSEVLAIVEQLGYRKTAEPSPMPKLPRDQAD